MGMGVIRRASLCFGGCAWIERSQTSLNTDISTPADRRYELYRAHDVPNRSGRASWEPTSAPRLRHFRDRFFPLACLGVEPHFEATVRHQSGPVARARLQIEVE